MSGESLDVCLCRRCKYGATCCVLISLHQPAHCLPKLCFCRRVVQLIGSFVATFPPNGALNEMSVFLAAHVLLDELQM